MPRVKTLRLDRVFPGIGRIALASGATTKKEHNQRDALLTELYKKPEHWGLLRAIRAGTFSIHEVYAADLVGRLPELLGARSILNQPLWVTVEGWVPHSALAPASRTRYDGAFKFLRRTGKLPENATVGDLETVDWRGLHNEGRIGPTGWNRLRSAVSAFLSHQLGDTQHPTRRAVMQRFPREDEPERVSDLPLALFWGILSHV